MKRIIVLLLLIVQTLDAYEFAELNVNDLPNPAVSISKDEQGDFQEVILREWQDRVDTEEGRKTFVFKQGYDYTKKQGFLKSYDTNNNLLHAAYSPENDGGVSSEELLVAFDLFKKAPEIIEQLKPIKEKLYIYGGFNYQDKKQGQPCYRGNRCVHVFVSSSTDPVVAHAIVKLTDKTIPYPRFDTDMTTKKLVHQKSKEYFKKQEKEEMNE